jgi:hypothetical protein
MFGEGVPGNDVRRRICGVYFGGKITQENGVYTVYGINRYTTRGVKLRCAIQMDAIYITHITPCDLDVVAAQVSGKGAAKVA